jgi:hypothetical protein
MIKKFLSGDEVFAEGIRLACPEVISAYPITPQTIVVERLSEMVENGSLDAEFIHVESEHSALSCAILDTSFRFMQASFSKLRSIRLYPRIMSDCAAERTASCSRSYRSSSTSEAACLRERRDGASY